MKTICTKKKKKIKSQSKLSIQKLWQKIISTNAKIHEYYIRSMQMKVNITRKRTNTTYKFCIIIERW